MKFIRFHIQRSHEIYPDVCCKNYITQFPSIIIIMSSLDLFSLDFNKWTNICNEWTFRDRFELFSPWFTNRNERRNCRGEIGLFHKFGVQPAGKSTRNSKNGLKQPMRKRIDKVGRWKGRANTLFTSACVPDAPKPRRSYLSGRRSYFIRSW